MGYDEQKAQEQIEAGVYQKEEQLANVVQLGGYVTSPKMFIGKQNTIDEAGLLSQRIFGPVNSFKCSCGKLSLRIDRGKTCETCGVKCDSNNLRVVTFGKIQTVFPVIKLNKLIRFQKIFGTKIKDILDPINSDRNMSLEKYIAITPDGETIQIVSEVHHASLYILPLRITGIYSLILGIKYLINNFLNDLPIISKLKELFDENVISHEIKVLPPEIRPVIIDQTKTNTVRITKVNKHYTSILQLNKSNQLIQSNIPVDEEYWWGLIDTNFRLQNNEQIIEYGIMEYDRITSRYQYYSDLIYESIFEIISKKEGFIRSLVLSKTIDFSARSVVRSDISVKPYQVKVSKKILFKLWKLHFTYYLCNIEKMDYDRVLEKYMTKEYYEIKDKFNDFLNWFYDTDKY